MSVRILWLVLLSAFVLSGCPELPDHGAKILHIVDTCCDEISGAGGMVIAFYSRDGEEEGWLTDYRSYAGSPNWTSDGDRILYICNGDIMLMDQDGGNKKAVLEDSGAFLLRLSADEKRAVYLKPSDSVSYEVRSVNLDGTDDKVLVTGANERVLGVAPVTGRILFSRTTEEPDPIYTTQNTIVYRIYSMAPDGSGEVELCGDYADGITLGEISPDGQLAILFAKRNLPPDTPEVALPYSWAKVVARVDGTGEPAIVMDGLMVLADYETEWPHFNLDGSRLAFADGAKIVTMTPQLGDRKELALSNEAGISSVYFDPGNDGRLWFHAESLPALGFTQYASGAASLNLDGTDLRREPVGPAAREAYQPGR